MVDTVLLQLNVDLLYLELGQWVNLLEVEIGGDCQLVLFEIAFGALNIEGAIHDLDVDLKTGRLLLEVREGKAPVSTLNLDGVTLLVEIVGKIVDLPG